MRVSELNVDGGHIPARYLGHLAWYQNLPDNPQPGGPNEQFKLRPTAAPRLDLQTGALTGFDLFYHDQRYLLITWDEQAVAPETWHGVFADSDLARAVNWGINRPETRELTAPEVRATVTGLAGALSLRVWRQPGTVLLRIANAGTTSADATLTLNLEPLGVKVKKLWSGYTQCLGGTLDEVSGKLTVKGIPPGKASLIFIDTF